MAPANEDAYLTIFVTALVAGGGKFFWDLVKGWKSPEPKQPKALVAVSVADANLESVAKARDELIEDNMRLRSERIEQDARHAEERKRWLFDQERLRADITILEGRLRSERDDADRRSARLEKQIRDERVAANRRYDALLNQVNRLGTRTNELEGGS